MLSKAMLSEAIVITESEALKIASDFAEDMIKSGITLWNSSTEITRVVKLYDNTNTNTVNAYCIELTNGYIIVSAYLDADCLIPEWSDSSLPIYSVFDSSITDKIIYLGGYEYYLDKGSDNALDLNGKLVSKSVMTNLCGTSRDICNIPISIINACTVNTETYSSNGAITDPIEDANITYNGDFVCEEYTNNWEQYIEKTSSGQYNLFYGIEANNYGWYGSCGPVAISNIVMTYKNKYPDNHYIPENRNALINVIANHGINHSTNGIQWYVNGTGTNAGTSQLTEHHYILSCLNGEFAIPCNVVPYNTTYVDIKNSIDSGALVYINVFYHSYYGNHAMMCYAYTRLRDNNSGYYKTYLKVADGFSSNPRYVDLATCLNNPSNNEYGDFSHVYVWE